MIHPIRADAKRHTTDLHRSPDGGSAACPGGHGHWSQPSIRGPPPAPGIYRDSPHTGHDDQPLGKPAQDEMLVAVRLAVDPTDLTATDQNTPDVVTDERNVVGTPRKGHCCC